jgi:hypothetical protein
VALLPPKALSNPGQLKRRGPAKKIIGAALAGLSAGFELTQAGHDDGLDTVSALMVLRDDASFESATGDFHIRGGNDLLPRAFADRLREKIRSKKNSSNNGTIHCPRDLGEVVQVATRKDPEPTDKPNYRWRSQMDEAKF